VTPSGQTPEVKRWNY